MRRYNSNFGKTLRSVCVANVMVTAVLALLAVGTGQVLGNRSRVG